MTNLKRTMFDKNLFQKHKMTEEVNQNTIEMTSPEMKMVYEILEKVLENSLLKETMLAI